MKDQKYTTNNAEETQLIAEKLVKDFDKRKNNFASGQLVCLWGDLGAGKTTFSQGFAKSLGVKGVVNSPTFLIMKKYILSDKWKGFNLFHFDAYRIQDAEEILDLGWQEIMENKNNIILLEWPEKIFEILPRERIDIRFSIIKNDIRNIVLEKNKN